MSTSREESRKRNRLMHVRVLDPTATDPAFGPLRDRGMNLVPGTGSLLATVVIVGEAPGEIEDTEKVPFVGPAGILLDEFIALAHLERPDCWITNVVKYRPATATGENRQPTHPERIAGRKYLARELAIIQPKLVVLAGRTAYQSVKTGQSIVRDRGKGFRNPRWPDRLYYPVLHPSACLQGPDEWMDRTRCDWRRIDSHALAIGGF